jgi:FkbM family methyltransferase
MRISNFIYRQKQKIKYHFANNSTEKLIAEINRFDERIEVQNQAYYVKELNFYVPKSTCDFVFASFSLFISNAKNLNGNYSFEFNELQFTWEDYKINITSASEIFIINEIFVEKCYQFKMSTINNKDLVVFDIGMNVGLASLFFSNMPQVKKIYGFEPFNPTYLKAKANFYLNPKKTKKINPLNFGLGADNKELEVPYSSLNTGINSTVNSNERKSDDNKAERIQIRDIYIQINELIKIHSESEIIIKIDTEGAEFEIFERLEREKFWDNVRMIMLEWHFDSPVTIEKYLNNNGFSIVSTVINKNAGLIYAFRTDQ